MKKTSNSIDHIDAYLDGLLNKEEAAAFERQLSADKRLVEEVRWQLDLRSGIDLYEANRVKAVLQREETPWLYLQIQKRSTRWMSAAAVFLFVVGVYLVMSTQPVYYQFLANQYFEPYPNVIQPVSRSEVRPADTMLSKGMSAYDQGQYQLAIVSLLNCKESSGLPVSFYLGICYYQTGQWQNAIKEFDLIKSHHDSTYFHAALWYEMLTYLKLGDLNNVENNIQMLIEEPSVYARKAAKIQVLL